MAIKYHITKTSLKAAFIRINFVKKNSFKFQAIQNLFSRMKQNHQKIQNL